MATIYTSDSLRNIFQSSFNLAQWYSFSQHFFNASELKEKPERIIENTSDEGYYLGNINTTDSYRIGLFHYNYPSRLCRKQTCRTSQSRKIIYQSHLGRI